jgi:hypothetical protein
VCAGEIANKTTITSALSCTKPHGPTLLLNSMDPETTPRLVAGAALKIIDWYWTHGIRRNGAHLLSSGSWLNTAYQAKKMADRMDALPDTKRKAMALWGPSQSGKSTLLSAFIDRPAAGMKSALQWSALEPVEFVGGENKWVKLNPYNFQSDASGCVSRFMLTEKVRDSQFPVEFILATSDQLLQALGIGYMTECAGGWDRYLSGEAVKKMIDEANAGYTGGARNRIGYEMLHDLTVVLDDLILARWPRYLGLAQHWSHLRSAILESDALLSNEKMAKKFITDLLWDGEQRLLSTYEDLLAFRKLLRKAKSLWASFELTREVLDINSAANYESRDIGAVKYNEVDGEYKFDFKGSYVCAKDPSGFALFQALIWEIRIPLNAEVLKQTSPDVAAVLETTDFIDFPGVSREGDGGTKTPLDSYSNLDIFTKVLKRGKTASVVISYASSLAIDGFSLLMRAQSALAQPRQLTAGLTAWTNSLGLEWPPIHNGPPLNIVLTFCAKLIGDVHTAVASGRNLDGASEIFAWFESIRNISDPRWAKFWATSYPRFSPEGRISGSEVDAIAAAGRLMQFEAFKERFAHRPGNLANMVEASLQPDGDGGVHEFLGAIASQLAGSELAGMRQARLEDIWAQLRILCEEAFPSHASDESSKAIEIRKWQHELLSRISERQQLYPEDDATTVVAGALMRVMSVSADVLDPIPANAATNNSNGFLGQQINSRWLDHAREQRDALPLIALDDPGAFNRRLEYLAEHVLSNGDLAAWMQKHLGRLSRPEDLRHHRKYLSLRISDVLLYGATSKRLSHRSAKVDGAAPSDVFRALTAFAEHEIKSSYDRKVEDTAHFVGVIQPFLSNLDAVAVSRSRTRDKQPGDTEMATLQLSLGYR